VEKEKILWISPPDSLIHRVFGSSPERHAGCGNASAYDFRFDLISSRAYSLLGISPWRFPSERQRKVSRAKALHLSPYRGCSVAIGRVERGIMTEYNSRPSLWAEVLKGIRSNVSRQQFETWFSKIHAVSLDGDKARLAVPNHFLRDWLNNYYRDILQREISRVTNGDPDVEIVVREPEHMVNTETSAPVTPSSPIWSATPIDPDQVGLRPHPKHPHFISDVLLNESYNFANFVVGPSNKLPHAAARAVAEQPSSAYNPLFFHGSVGLGKTHLLQAICHSVLAERRDLKILYLSCETFTNQYISAVKSGNLRNFRYRYRYVDLLLIDDINFLQRKEQTQEEFFHTFNTLYNQGKQIVLSSDSPPKEIPTLEERLVSRFKWGLVAEIEPPDYETRILIVRHKARMRGIEFPPEICEYIADRFTGNIRELEGAILKVVSVATLNDRPVDLHVARDALRPLLAPARQKVTVERIIEAVTRFYDVKQADLQSRKRSKSIAFPRQICMFLARRLTNHSLEEIGGYFGGRDHTTVIYGTEKIRGLFAKDRKVKSEIETLIQEIQA
jgi:chromosomal replication initiator protein